VRNRFLEQEGPTAKEVAMKLGNILKKTALAAALAGGALVATASSADARIVCNRWGHCWHTYYPYYGDPYYDPYYYPSYYGPGYYGPSYYGPGVTFGFTFGGGHSHGHGGHWHH
jgi:hypothetical protein